MKFSALILAGGKSTRMGEDKALILTRRNGVPLWKNQVNLLTALAPCEIFWSGPQRQEIDLVANGLTWISDARPDCGPLGGIVAGLHAMQGDRLLVLALDLPKMASCQLRRLVDASTSAQGTVVHSAAFFEPLAAVYPRAILPLAETHLASGQLSLQHLLRVAVKEGTMQAIPLDEEDKGCFENWNQQEDRDLL